METAALHWTEAEKANIRASLDNMLGSPLFAGSPRQQRFLDYLVTNTLAGDADRLKGYTIALEVFDRQDDFDPSLDAIVRVEATRLRNKLREYYDTLGAQDNVRIDFPKGGYALEISIQAAPVLERRTNINIPRLVEDRPSLAVLPFANIGSDNTKEYFADGVVDSLIAMFSRLSGLFVISRQSAFSYKNTVKTSEQIAAELGVRYLLEGSVQHAGNQVRVTAQLADTKNGGHVWSDRYDRELKDVFTLQDELTQSIVSVLQIKLDGAEAALFGVQATNSIEAHDTLLRGIATHRKYTQKTSNEAIVLYQSALALDPNYAAAHAWLARSLSLTWSQRWNADAAVLALALSHAERAAELDPQSSYAISMLGWVQLWRKNRDESIAHCRRAVVLDPNNAEAHLFLSLALSAAGLGEEALYYVEKAKRFSPVADAFYMFAHAQSYFAQKNYAKAISIFEQGCILSENFKPNHFFLMIAYDVMGRHEEAQQKFELLSELTGSRAEMPNVIIWTDKALAKQQEETWQRIVARYA
jgi:TolB-like protein/Flp pilus assembly protein TadD